VAFLFRSARLALWADALKPLPPHRLNRALRFSAERAKARIERIPRRFQDFHWHRLRRFNSVAAGVPLRLFWGRQRRRAFQVTKSWSKAMTSKWKYRILQAPQQTRSQALSKVNTNTASTRTSRPSPRRLTLLKVDTTPALQHLPSKVKNIEYCDE